MNELPMWAQLLATGVALLAWFEARMVLRRECVMKHADVDVQLKQRHTAIQELRNAMQPLMIEVGKLEQAMARMHDDVKTAEEQRLQLHEDVRAVRANLEARSCIAHNSRK